MSAAAGRIISKVAPRIGGAIARTRVAQRVLARPRIAKFARPVSRFQKTYGGRLANKYVFEGYNGARDMVVRGALRKGVSVLRTNGLRLGSRSFRGLSRGRLGSNAIAKARMQLLRRVSGRRGIGRRFRKTWAKLSPHVQMAWHKFKQAANSPLGREIRDQLIEQAFKSLYEAVGPGDIRDFIRDRLEEEIKASIKIGDYDSTGTANPYNDLDLDTYLEPEFKEHARVGFARASQSGLGYHVEIVNGKKIMYVRGTRPNVYDWGKNVGDLLPGRIPGAVEAAKLDLAAKIIKPDLVVGHSRGGHVIARMKYGKANGRTTYVGFDAAQRLSRGSERNLLNIAQDQPFDRFIGRGGKNNVYLPYDYAGGNFHNAYA